MADRRKMGKGQMVKALEDNLGYSRRSASRIVNLIVASMKDALKAGMDVKIDGLGTLKIVHTKIRRRKIGCTPKSGGSIYNYRPTTIKLTNVKLKLEA